MVMDLPNLLGTVMEIKYQKIFLFKIVKLVFIKILKLILLSVLMFSVKVLESLLNKEVKNTHTHAKSKNWNVWTQYNTVQDNTAQHNRTKQNRILLSDEKIWLHWIAAGLLEPIQYTPWK